MSNHLLWHGPCRFVSRVTCAGGMKMAEQREDRGRDESTERERGRPGGGVGRREKVGGSGVCPASAGHAPPDAEIRTPMEWGQGERGAAGYEDSGQSELHFTEEELRAAEEQ